MKFSIEKLFFTIAIISLPFLNVFALMEKVSLSLFFFTIIFFISFSKLKFSKSDFFYFLFILFLILSTLVNNYINKSSLLYIISFIILYTVYNKNVVYWYSKHKALFYKVLFCTVMFSSFFIFYEFITINFNKKLFIHLPRITVDFYDARFLGLFRPRAFAEESGHMSFFYEFSIPLLIPFIRNLKKKRRIFSIGIISIAILLLGSSFTIFISLGILGLFGLAKSLQKIKIFAVCFILIIGFITFLNIHKESSQYVNKYSNAILDKVSLNKNNSSVSDRTIRFEKGVELVKNNFFSGIGAMAFNEYSTSASSLNMMIDLWLYSGVLGILSISLFLLIRCLKFLTSKSMNKHSVFLSFFILLLHYQIITNYWFPFLWILLGIMESETRENKTQTAL